MRSTTQRGERGGGVGLEVDRLSLDSQGAELDGVRLNFGQRGGERVVQVAKLVSGYFVGERDALQLPSGRWQARYPGPDGIDRAAPNTFVTKTDAELCLTHKEAEILKGDWLNPNAGEVLFADYATAWVAERPNLRPKTQQLYGGVVRLHLVPVLGKLKVPEVKEGTVRRWRTSKAAGQVFHVNQLLKITRLLPSNDACCLVAEFISDLDRYLCHP